MRKQTAGAAVSGTAQFADERLLSGVCEGVLFQILVSGKRLAACVAMVIRFARVSSHMILESVRRFERGAAYVTNKGIVAYMNSLVSFLVTWENKAFATILTNMLLRVMMRLEVKS